ncbi:hypothetical protein B0H17DRAFT_1126179 [Mycena rosella]|uniref:Uncharacterized protein n=1 Tax=Mycena rosella TaxID=1033263 RepID=A0AAD7GU14_MYCRO|nr:hypothetical protein B0H17DRAFT_1126179 [Mycena rosella]
MASQADLQTFYRTYIEAINALPTSTLDPFLAPEIIHNDKRLSATEYRALILDQSTFTIEDLVLDEHTKRIAARLSIEVGLGARRIKENVFYSLNADGRIQQPPREISGFFGYSSELS